MESKMETKMETKVDTKHVYVLTKQLVLPTTTTIPLVLGVFGSFYKATKDISTKWVQISKVQWAYEHNNVRYIVTKHEVK